MIAPPYIAEWRHQAPWVRDLQVEQDLILSRALVALFRQASVAEALAWRGGTALYKLHMRPAARYSEDIDLVQLCAEPIGPTLDGVREALDPWLGTPRRKFGEGRVTLVYRMKTDGPPELPMRLKIEINSREHFSVFGIKRHLFKVNSRWFSGEARIPSYLLAELLGTKLRALYQRKKGRDLFDLATALERTQVDPERIVTAFEKYMEHEGRHVSRAELVANLRGKLADSVFTGDLQPLLASGVSWDFEAGSRVVQERLFPLLT